MTHKVTAKNRRMARTLAGLGIDQGQIGKVIGVSLCTLRKHYRDELDRGMIDANAKVAESLFRQATNPDKPNVAATIFWLKCRCGWKEAPDPGKKETAVEAARAVAAGEFRPAPAPLRIVK